MLIFLISLQTAQAQEKIVLFAAASLKNALEDIAEDYAKGKDLKIVVAAAASSALSRQIEEGAEADIFISADEAWMNRLAQKKRLARSLRRDLLGNSLVLIAPLQSSISLPPLGENTPWQSLLENENDFLAVGDPSHVPAGIYAKEALTKLGAWAFFSKRIAKTASVRAALALVERGECPVGAVYLTDALISKKVKVIGVFPPSSHEKILYPLAVVKDRDRKSVRDFYFYLQGSEAKSVFERYGFVFLPRPAK